MPDLQRQRLPVVLRRQETPRERHEAIRSKTLVPHICPSVRRAMEAFLSQRRVPRNIGSGDRGEY